MSFSGFSNSNIQDAQGVNRAYSLGSKRLDIASKHISGFGLNSSKATTSTMLTSIEQKVSDYSEFYSAIISPKIYKPAEILVSGEISQTIKTTVISAAKNILDKVASFKTTFLNIKTQMQDMTISDTALASLTEQLYAQMKSFNIEKKGVKIIIEKGNAINKAKRPSDISDINNLLPTDYDKLDGIDICYRMIVENDSGTLGKIEIDTLGNCNASFNSLTVTGALNFTNTATDVLIDGGSWD
jgi:hypothetical protein